MDRETIIEEYFSFFFEPVGNGNRSPTKSGAGRFL
jgi:hypothetical protein